MPGDAIHRGDPEVVRHQVHVVHHRLHLCHLGVGDERRKRARGKRQEALAPACGGVRVEGSTQLGHHGGEVGLVLWPVRVVVAWKTGIFPVHVEPVEVVSPYEGDGALHEPLPPFRREHGVRESLGPGPSADRHQHLQVRMRSSHGREHLEVVGIACEALDDLPVPDVRKGVVDVGELLGGNSRGVEQPLLREQIANHGGADGSGRRMHRQAPRGQHNDHPRPSRAHRAPRDSPRTTTGEPRNAP